MPIRETFWNVPHWAEIAQYLLAVLTVVIFTFGVFRRIGRIRKGKPNQPSNQFTTRLVNLFYQAVGQVRTAQDPYAGIMHLTIFWGIVMLLIGTILATIDWDITHLFFDYQFLKGGVYLVYELVLDICGFLLIVGLGMALYRRYVSRPSRLKRFQFKNLERDDAYTLIMLGLIAFSGYLTEGLRISAINPDWAAWSPLGRALAALFASMSESGNLGLHFGLWAFHTLVAFVFIASVPYTKLFHIFSVPANIFFQSLKPAGSLSPARTNSGPGVSQWEDFTWKQLLDTQACMRCGRCQDQCPAYSSGLKLSPRDLMIKIDHHIWSQRNGGGLYPGVVTGDELWSCTTCRACSDVCPAFIDHISSIVDLRRYLVDQGEIDGLLQDSLAKVARYGNSFGQSDRIRARWAQSLPFTIKDARREPVEFLWFVGDYASYNTSIVDTTVKAAHILKKSNLDFGILYESERNTGNDVRRVGEEGLFEMLMEKNLASLSRCEYKTILTTDPHSYNTIKNEYLLPENRQDGPNGHIPVVHFSELLDQLLLSGQLKVQQKLGLTVTYHDPCYLGRYNQIYDPPRRVIQAIGCTLMEMPRHANRALCCGAGGGRIWMEELPVKERASEIRVREAAALDEAQALVVACPKDTVMFNDAVKTSGVEGRLVVKDLIDLVYEAV